MGISKTGCSKSITKEDLEHEYKNGFSDGVREACLLILESLKDQRFDIIDNKKENCAIALDTIDKSIKSVEDRLNHYNRPLN